MKFLGIDNPLPFFTSEVNLYQELDTFKSYRPNLIKILTVVAVNV